MEQVLDEEHVPELGGAAALGAIFGIIVSAQFMAMGVFAPVPELPAVGDILSPVLGPLAALVFGFIGAIGALCVYIPYRRVTVKRAMAE